MASEHIYKQFDSDLEAIRAKVLEMGTLVEEQTANAVKSLLNTDIKLAEEVMKRDNQINDLEMAIDEETSLLIAKRSPAAGDLRNIMMMLKIITDLEQSNYISKTRIGRRNIYEVNFRNHLRHHSKTEIEVSTILHALNVTNDNLDSKDNKFASA